MDEGLGSGADDLAASVEEILNTPARVDALQAQIDLDRAREPRGKEAYEPLETALSIARFICTFEVPQGLILPWAAEQQGAAAMYVGRLVENVADATLPRARTDPRDDLVSFEQVALRLAEDLLIDEVPLLKLLERYVKEHIPGDRGFDILRHVESLRTDAEYAQDDVRRLRLAVRQEHAVRESEESARKVEVIAEVAATASGTVAAGSLASEFNTILVSERYQANLFRVLTILVATGAVAYTALVAWHEHDNNTLMIQKLALALPVLLLAGYLGRESSQHRHAARWAHVLTAQLRTIQLFTPQLDEAGKAELYSAFGLRVFSQSGPSPRSDSDSSNEAILRQVVEIVRGVRA